MPVPSAITDLSQSAGSNSPAGSESPALLDNYDRAHASFIAMLRDGQGFSTPLDIASAATVDIGGQASFCLRITGTTTITSFGTNYNGPRFLVFGGALTLTHNATSLIIPGGASITTAAGDCAILVPNLATPTGWRVQDYQRANGTSLAENGVQPGPIGSSGLTMNAGRVLGRPAGSGTGVPSELTSTQVTAFVDAASTTAAGKIEIADTNEAQAGTNDTNAITPLKLRSAFGAGGTAPVFAVRAWCVFGPTGTLTTAGNVSSITKLATGRFQVNFTTAIFDSFYACIANSDANSSGGFVFSTANAYQNSASSCIVSIVDASGTARDPATFCSVIVVR